MNISKRSLCIPPSLTRSLFNKAKEYDDVIDLTLGDPDFNTPNDIKEAGIRAIKENKSHYSMNAGIYEARCAVSERVKNVWNVDCCPDKNVILTVGGMEALYLALLSLVDAEDEVILFAPYYVNYMHMVRMCGGKPVVLDCYDTISGLSIDAKKLESVITEKTVAIIINSPNNPTGDIIGYESLKSISEIANKYDLTVISDEVYRTLIYDGLKHHSILELDNMAERTILIDSLSKEFCMTGWRLGFAYGPEKVISSMIKLQENVAACANVPAQYALIQAYMSNGDNNMITKFCQRRDCLVKILSEVTAICFNVPKGTFYMFVDISRLNIDSEEFAYRLLEKKHIAVVPGKAYGESYGRYIRIAFTKDIEQIKKAAYGIRDFISELIDE